LREWVGLKVGQLKLKCEWSEAVKERSSAVFWLLRRRRLRLLL
jgi:hypothetical protein